MNKFLSFFAALFIFACVSVFGRHQIEGVKTFRVKGFNVSIVDKHPAVFGNDNVRGSVISGNIIVEGHYYEGKIIVDSFILGHEVRHLLANKHPDIFWDPDKVE